MQCPMRKYVTQKKRTEKKESSAQERDEGEGNTRRPVFPWLPRPSSRPLFRQPSHETTSSAGRKHSRAKDRGRAGRNRSFERRASHAPAHPSRHFWPSASRFRAGRPRSICGLGPWFEVFKDDEPALFPFAPLPSSQRGWQVARRHPDADPWRGCSDLATIYLVVLCFAAGYGLRCRNL